MVPGGGIEPPTRGFSIHCSTPELPGHGWRWRHAPRVSAVLGPTRGAVHRGLRVFFAGTVGLNAVGRGAVPAPPPQRLDPRGCRRDSRSFRSASAPDRHRRSGANKTGAPRGWSLLHRSDRPYRKLRIRWTPEYETLRPGSQALRRHMLARRHRPRVPKQGVV